MQSGKYGDGMKTVSICGHHNYRILPNGERETVCSSFGSEELQLATPEDIAKYRGRSALNELERVLFVLAAQTRWNRK